jgi:CRP-like cAMP-binding protein/tRNA A-37 threonylcarbamoyl transferase component Bud32
VIFGKKDEEELPTKSVPPGWEISDLGLLGQGGMSKVHRVRDETLGREVALKVLRPELLKAPEALDRFVEEAKITAQLDHPNIPPVYALAAGNKKSTCFTMKVLQGVTLQELLQKPKAPGMEGLFEALEVLVRVCDAMAFAHERGILHCDLKPQNVMVGQHGQIYVVDWGLARRKASLASEESDRPSGTPAYMAPEQARGQNRSLDERTDVFALGGILYRILVGHPPYTGKTAEEVLLLAEQCRIKSPHDAAPAGMRVPRRLIDICMRALQEKPDDRYPNVVELRKELEDFIRGIARLPEQHFLAGEAIVREGETGECAYIILDGHCQANREVAGKTQMLRLLGPGEMFGEAAVLTGEPRFATVVALMDTTVAVVERIFLQEEMERTSLIALAIRTLAASFLDLNGQTAALLKEKTFARAIDLTLRELALKGRTGADDSRWVPWKVLLEQLVQKTGLGADEIADRLARQPGIKINPAADKLQLNP